MKKIIQALLSPLGFQLTRITHSKVAASSHPDRPKELTFGLEELGMQPTLRGLVHRQFRPKTILDIGASNGRWTRECSEHFPDSNYFLIEPMEEHTQALVALSDVNSKISFEIAAADTVSGKVVELGISPDLAGSSLHHPTLATRKVPTVSLDQLFADGRFKQPDLIKLDIQGHEHAVLLGATEVLKNCRLVLSECVMHPYTNTMNLMGDIVALLAEQEFMPYEIVDVIRRRHSGAMSQCDILFVKKGDPLIDHCHFTYPHTGTFFNS
jgi:FkbM family methyltransferase